MKPSDVSVSVSDFGGKVFVNVTFELRGHSLGRETAAPDPQTADANIYGTRVREGARKAKAKELRKLIENMEFPDA